MGEIKILSLNCQGLRDKQKRRDVINYLKNKKFSIYCLQDTHFIKSDENQIKTLWGYKVYMSYGKSNARGVAILLNNNFEFKILSEKSDETGNYIVLEILIENKYTFTLINIYAPNKDEPSFFNNLKGIIEELQNDFVILTGDFNMVQDPNLDYFQYKNVNNPKARQEVLKIKEQFKLIDPWRVNNEDKKHYTWFSQSSAKKARLDFFLISEEIMTLVSDTDIKPGYRTDHSIVELNLRLSDFKRGKGFWKFNNNLLRDTDYVTMIKNLIVDLKHEYLDLDINNNDSALKIKDDLLLDMLLLKIRGASIQYSARKKRERDKSRINLELRIIKLNELISQEPNKIEYTEEMKKLNEELEKLRQVYIKGLLIRTKAKWVEEGEKPTKYFCGLEKRNYLNKTITCLKNNNGSLIQGQKEILDEIETFYKNLYLSRDDSLEEVNLNECLNYDDIKKLNKTQANSLEGAITTDELLKALKNMKNDKSPGPDGFTTEFFKFFWIDINDFLIKSYNCSLQKGELSLTQKQGIISILPKGDKSRNLIKNWRPISLLNVTYKLISSCIANRLKSTLDYLIHENQRGFIAGRFIGENTRIIYDVLQITKEKNIPGALLLIDFEKAFDSVSWKFIFKTLQFFNFGHEFIKYVKTLYNNAELCVIQNGIFSQFFKISRGCRQGDPISPYLFILCAEIMANMFRHNKNIKGINIDNTEICLLQYADDTCIFLDGSEKSLKSSLDLLFQFSKYSGLKPNIEKTKAIWIGSKINSKDMLCKDTGLEWTSEAFTVLGIKYTPDLEHISISNYSNKLSEIQRDLKSWSKRNLTLFGKITVIKSLLLPKLTHLFTSLPKPENNIIQKLEKAFYNYLWEGKIDKVNRKLIIQDYELGGCRMVDIKSFIKALKLSWLRRLQLRNDNIFRLFSTIVNVKLKHVDDFGDDFCQLKANSAKNVFWKEVLTYFAEFKRITPKSNKRFSVLDHSLWYNSKIKMDKSTIFWKKWYEKGIVKIRDLLNGNRKIMELKEIENKYDIKIHFTNYEGIKRSIISTLNIKENDQNIDNLYISDLKFISKYSKGTQHIYDVFIKEMYIKPKIESKWTQELNLPESFNWSNVYTNLYKNVKDPKLKWLNFRIIHRIYGTNVFLQKIKLKSSSLCTFCKTYEEDLCHLFFDCPYVRTIWSNIEEWISNKVKITHNVTVRDAILGKYGKKEQIINKIVNTTKHYITVKRYNEQCLNFNELKHHIFYLYITEKKQYQLSDNLKIFEKIWGDYKNMFNE